MPSCKKTVMGCADPLACNYSDDVTEDNGSCTYSTEIFDCDGNCIDDADEDGVCDQQESFGCGDVTACNYSSEVTESVDSLCVYAQEFYDCDGDCINDETMGCDELKSMVAPIKMHLIMILQLQMMIIHAYFRTRMATTWNV